MTNELYLPTRSAIHSLAEHTASAVHLSKIPSISKGILLSAKNIPATNLAKDSLLHAQRSNKSFFPLLEIHEARRHWRPLCGEQSVESKFRVSKDVWRGRVQEVGAKEDKSAAECKGADRVPGRGNGRRPSEV
ncbi:hypothetical protein KM043_004972 [Ampulex compressa]|nr:hypothetical protein KM043_004972 [Ampulex compressa]